MGQFAEYGGEDGRPDEVYAQFECPGEGGWRPGQVPRAEHAPDSLTKPPQHDFSQLLKKVLQMNNVLDLWAARCNIQLN